MLKTAASERLLEALDAGVGQIDVARVLVRVEMDARPEGGNDASQSLGRSALAPEASSNDERDARLVNKKDLLRPPRASDCHMHELKLPGAKQPHRRFHPGRFST